MSDKPGQCLFWNMHPASRTRLVLVLVLVLFLASACTQALAAVSANGCSTADISCPYGYPGGQTGKETVLWQVLPHSCIVEELIWHLSIHSQDYTGNICIYCPVADASTGCSLGVLHESYNEGGGPVNCPAAAGK